MFISQQYSFEWSTSYFDAWWDSSEKRCDAWVWDNL